MVRFSRILRDYQDAGTVSGLIALWGFVRDAVFLTKAGGVGVAYRLSPADTECMDAAARVAMAARTAQALRQLAPDVHLYTYLLKRAAAVPLPPAHANAVLNAAVQERAAYIASAAHGFYTCEHYLVLLAEGLGFPRHQSLARLRGSLSNTTQQTHLHAQLDEAIDELLRQAAACVSLLDDILHPQPLSKEEIFRFLRRLCNYADWKADAAPLKYNTYLDYFVADSTLECHRTHLQLDDYHVKVLTMKEPPSSTDAQSTPSSRVPNGSACRPSACVARSARNARHYFNKRISLVNYLSPNTTPDQTRAASEAS